MTSESKVEPESSDAGSLEERALPELEGAQRAFDVGDFKRVRELLEPLLTDTNADVREAAQALRRRVSVDPFQVGLLLTCLAFFIYVTWHYVF